MVGEAARPPESGRLRDLLGGLMCQVNIYLVEGVKIRS
jgi:hypothetical protein